jgi:hypothetical protein
MKFRICRVVTTALLLLAPAAAAACGTERHLVKVAADQSAVRILDFARSASVADLAAIDAPSRPDARPSARFTPTELTVYQAFGRLAAVEKEPNGDYRLIIADPDHPEITMIAVAPDPACASGSRFADNVAAVWRSLDRKSGQFPKLTPNLPVTATGIAFFSSLRGQEGAAPNGIELAPLIGVAFPW